MSFLQKAGEQLVFDKFFTPKGMYPVRFKEERKGKTMHFGGAREKEEMKKRLASMAKKLKVDAVLLVEVRYCYEGGFLSLGGAGQAFLQADSSVKAVNRKGELVVDMPAIEGCGNNAIETDTGVGMLGGKLLLAKLAKERYTAMFMEANTKIAKQTIGKIQDAMN